MPSIPALIDNGAEVCCISEELIKSLLMAPSKMIKLSDVRGGPETVGCDVIYEPVVGEENPSVLQEPCVSVRVNNLYG